MTLRDYMDYHLSCYYFVTAIEQKRGVDAIFFSPWRQVRATRSVFTSVARALRGVSS